MKQKNISKSNLNLLDRFVAKSLIRVNFLSVVVLGLIGVSIRFYQNSKFFIKKVVCKKCIICLDTKKSY